MSSISTFGSFTTALLGIYTAQQGLNVTGNNISNINTPGYTRQALDQISLHMSGADRYYSQLDVKIGNGALGVGVSQLRDPYLDIRYRSEAANVGAMNKKLEGLNAIAKILDEVGAGDDENGIIGAQFSELLKALQNLSDQTNQGEYDTQVRSAAAALVSLFNSASTELQEVYNNTVKSFKQDLTTVNEILQNIRNLNSSIRQSDLHGDPALELRDERNRLIDELAEYVKIDVTYTEEDVGAGVMVEKLTIRLANANPDASVTTDSSMLVDGLYAAQFEMPENVAKVNPLYDPTDPASGRYLAVGGGSTNDITQAEMDKNTNYMLSLTKMLDSKGREWQEFSKPNVTVYKDKQAFDDAWNKITDNPKDDGNGTRIYYDFVTKEVKNPDGTTSTEYNLSEVVCKYTQEVNLDDNDLYGSLQSSRELLTEDGEFTSSGYVNAIDEKAASKRGIPYYQHALDLLANKLATVFNEANNGFMTDAKGNYIDENGAAIMVDGTALNKYVPLTEAQKTEMGGLSLNEYLKGKGVQPEGVGNLFSNHGSGNDSEGITAGNISVSFDWVNGNVKVVPSYIKAEDFEDIASTANENILHFRALLEKEFDFIPSDIIENSSNASMFHGSLMGMMNNIEGVLGNDQRSTQIILNTYLSRAIDLDTSRDAVSGVDLNDEAANLIKYQKAYTAACRLMTTLDEALEKLISNTGIVGR